MNGKDIIRRCNFKPYRKGIGPTFSLTMWDCPSPLTQSKSTLGYRLVMTSDDQRCPFRTKIRTVLFQGENYGCSPLHCIDSDAAVVGVMDALTLRPGDTDAEYFANYSTVQLEFAQQHGEALNCEVQRRFCDENGNVRRKN